MSQTRLHRRTVLAGIAVMATAGMGARPARPVAWIGCPDTAPEGLCDALVQAVAATGPAFVPRTAPARPAAGDVAITLVLDQVGAAGLTARLDWQGPAAAAIRQGPPMGLSVSDTGLRPAILARYAQALVAATPGLAAALAAQ